MSKITNTYRPGDTLYGNFKVYEATQSWTADRLGIKNDPSDEVITRAKITAKHILQPIRDHFNIPFSPASFIRTEKLEMIVARKGFLRWLGKHFEYKPDEFSAVWPEYFATKQHPKGEAVDVKLPGITTVELYEWCKNNLSYDQIILEGIKDGDPKSGVVHISYREGKNRNQAIDHYELG